VHVTSPLQQDTTLVQEMVQRAAVAISALSHRDAVLLPKLKVCIERASEGPNAGVSEAYASHT
jgi:hypothetical protein